MAEESSAVLTQEQRRYLRGEKELSKSNEKSLRSRIRDRVIRSVRDFVTLRDGLSADDRKKLFEKAHGGDLQQQWKHDPDEDWRFELALVAMFSFVYQGQKDMGSDIEDFEQLVERTISDAENPEMMQYGRRIESHRRVDPEVSIDLNEEYITGHKEARKKFLAGEDITPMEFYRAFAGVDRDELAGLLERNSS